MPHMRHYYSAWCIALNQQVYVERVNICEGNLQRPFVCVCELHKSKCVLKVLSFC